MELELIYEDNHLIVVNKPYGILVHVDKTGDTSMEDYVREYIREKYQKPGNAALNSFFPWLQRSCSYYLLHPFYIAPGAPPSDPCPYVHALPQ